MRQEWHRLFKNKILLIVTVAVIAIPTIYTTLFLGSMWDPYGNIDKLPVAVINHDVPVTYEDQKLDIGGTLMEELKKNDSLDFQFPSETEARKGLEDGTYYMVITIPEDFSAHASTLTDAHPEKMTLAYETNPGTNYIASKMSETAMKELESSVREEVTKTYTEVLFGKLAELGDGMQEAADGSGELKTGTDQLADGNQMITDNLQALSDSALVFVDGSRELEVGIGRYTDGASAVAAGAEELQRGANALDSGVNGAQKGGSDLAAGAVDVDDNMTMLNAGLSELNAAATALPDAADALNDGAASLGDSAQQLSDGIASLSEGAAGLKTGADALSSGLQSVASSSQSLRDGAAEISQALSALAGEEGVPAAVSGSDVNMLNYEVMDHFLKEASEGQEAETVLYRIHTDGTVSREKFTFDGQDMYSLYTKGRWTDTMEPECGTSSYSRINEWKYTEKGWFSYEYCTAQPPELTEVIDAYEMVRIRPLEEEYREMQTKYLKPIGYQGNNLLCSEWSEENMQIRIRERD